MSGWMTYFTGTRDTKKPAREAIITLRTNLQVLEKKEEYLQKKIEEELKKAKANAVSNKSIATAALRRKKAHETELDRLSGQRLTLETQVNALESANINQETLQAMKAGSEALKVIHGSMTIDKVDATMDSIREQMEITNEISNAISNPLVAGNELDEDELKDELAELEQEELNDRLMGADHVPVHNPASPTKDRVSAEASRRQTEEEDEEEEQFRQLQASLAM